MSQKGMSVIMQHTCQEAGNGNIDLKASVRHMGNTFLNDVETSQEEAACLVLQLPITWMSRWVLSLHTAYIGEWAFLLKDYETI